MQKVKRLQAVVALVGLIPQYPGLSSSPPAPRGRGQVNVFSDGSVLGAGSSAVLVSSPWFLEKPSASELEGMHGTCDLQRCPVCSMECVLYCIGKALIVPERWKTFPNAETVKMDMASSSASQSVMNREICVLFQKSRTPTPAGFPCHVFTGLQVVVKSKIIWEIKDVCLFKARGCTVALCEILNSVTVCSGDPENSGEKQQKINVLCAVCAVNHLSHLSDVPGGSWIGGQQRIRTTVYLLRCCGLP